MFNRTAQSIYKPLTLGLILAVSLIMLAHIGHTAKQENPRYGFPLEEIRRMSLKMPAEMEMTV